ncbi:putative dipeptidyl-aminopeptidase B [Aureobasidium pullulans]|nr:putative dipeptidyl-aminopeptidase B [Aureobasidium pullulans]THX67110.1 putative dipeptidyl-aminopeptidase B [Aureobasidium pullulans]
MAFRDDEEALPLTRHDANQTDDSDQPRPSASSISTTSLVLEHLSGHPNSFEAKEALYSQPQSEQFDFDDRAAWQHKTHGIDTKARRILYIIASIAAVGWLAALALFLSSGSYKSSASHPHDPHATKTARHGQKISLEQVMTGQFYPKNHGISWIEGAQGEDGLLLQWGGEGGRDYLVVEEVRYMQNAEASKQHSKTLMKNGAIYYKDEFITPSNVWPSADHKHVLVQSHIQKNWRHSNTGRYWIFDVESQSAEPLDPAESNKRIQYASWSPNSDAVVFTRDNNMYIRNLSDKKVKSITTDGGAQLFYGVPDWVYEEEVFASNQATWWSGDGKYLAFLRTDEAAVPEYPVQYFFSRPSGKQPKEGEENYPEVRKIKYPKAGAPMSVVTLQLYDVAEGQVFTVPIQGDFKDKDRLITEVTWAGRSGKVIIRETNRESDVLKVVLIDAERREGKTIREVDVNALDGGWFEVSQTTTYIPSDPANGREHEGYIDTVIHDGFDHLAYFTPLDNPEPIMLTKGKWEVVEAPSALDLKNNLVYFVATKKSSIERHIYSVKLDASDLKAVTDDSEVGYYSGSFSKGGGYLLLTNKGPGIPWQKVINTPSNSDKLEMSIEDNKALRELVTKTELPIEIYQTINVDGFDLNLVERRPPHFDETKKYPVLFYLYNGPGSQQVDRTFQLNFQSYIASSLGYIVVTLDGRGTGHLGRAARCIVRGNLGHYEAHDQIAVAKMWAAKKYVDAERIAIWGWSYGGFMTLKTLEQDAGQTFKYGMAVAPVTDWRYYDSIYTERYMHTPQHNPTGYDNSTISDVNALSKNVRFLVMHGVADDNVHFQNTLSLLDKLDLANVQNYDVHFFPDSDHSIYFHNANRVVYEKLSNWLINAFNGEWLRTPNPTPLAQIEK